MSRTKPCHNCPHLKNYEGGIREHEKALQGAGRFNDQPHPCHNAPTTPCFGHERDLKMVESGEAAYNGDTTKNTYTVQDQDGNIISEGELTHLEILELRNGLHQDKQTEDFDVPATNTPDS